MLDDSYLMVSANMEEQPTMGREDEQPTLGDMWEGRVCQSPKMGRLTFQQLEGSVFIAGCGQPWAEGSVSTAISKS